jgi:hypothetical protein
MMVDYYFCSSDKAVPLDGKMRSSGQIAQMMIL